MELHTDEIITNLKDILCYNDNWAFVHIPKNAGSSFKDCYKPWSPKLPLRQRELWAHQTPQWFINLVPELAKLRWVGIVRNPYARMVSWFFFLRERQAQGISPLDWNEMTFEYWLKTDQLSNSHKTQKYKSLSANGLTWRPIWQQKKWTQNVEVYRCEDQLHMLEDVVGFKFKHNFDNVSKHEDWQTYYTEELKEIVYKNYKEDFELFEYSK